MKMWLPYPKLFARLAALPRRDVYVVAKLSFVLKL